MTLMREVLQMRNKKRTKGLSILLALAVFAAGIQAFPVKTQAAVKKSQIAARYYNIINVGTGKYLDLKNNSPASQNNIQVKTGSVSKGQSFYIFRYGSNYGICPRTNKNYTTNGPVVNVKGNSSAPNSNVNIYRKVNDTTQQWIFEKAAGGYIIRSAKKTSSVLTATGSANGSNVNVQNYSSGNKNQIWKLTAPKTAVSSISLSSAAITCAAGWTGTLSTTVAPKNASSKKVTWSSSNRKVLAVDAKTGSMKALAPGKASVICKASDGSGTKQTCTVTVRKKISNPRLIKGVGIRQVSATLSLKKAAALKVTASPTKAANRKLKWTSSNSKVAAVNSSGKVTAKKGGSATITCTTTDGSKLSVSCKVKVKGWLWPSKARRVSSPYGYRTLGGKRKFHSGIDISTGNKAAIYAAQSGTVKLAAYSSSYGKHIIIQHPDNTWTLYAHCSSLKVKKGSTVSQGQVIGLTGSTGRVTGPHLHFEVHSGKYVRSYADGRKNPMSYKYSYK